MGNRTPEQNRLLNRLVLDCISYGFDEELALKYIKTQFGESITAPAYYARKKKVESEDSTDDWLNEHSRIGFVRTQRRHIEDIERLRDWAMERFFYESRKPTNEINIELVLKINEDIRLTTRFLNELNIGNPIIATMKAKNIQFEKKYKELLKTMNIPPTVTNQ